ncbi:MAG: helix-turn-helix domain-containing protein [Deltaproteobacteria bacterium]|nr:helix-turn-helix domain-containing protein [Candidatus Tharpella aukensis]
MRIVKNKNSAEIGSIEVAELLDVSPDNVNYMARKGILPGYKDKKFWRFNKRAVVRWIKSQKLVEV